MKNILKILFCIAVVIVFWSSLVGGISGNIAKLSGERIDNKQNIELPVIEYALNHKGTELAERSIVMRMDDVQAYSWRDVIMNLTDTVLANNMSITLSVIPGRDLNNDTILRNYLIEKSRDNRIEIAQHGLEHSPYEFLNLSKIDAYNAIKIGSDVLKDSLRIIPTTFVPPYNVYNDNTSIVLSELNFSIISGGRDEHEYINNIARFGFNTETKKSASKELIPANVVITECNKSLQERNICVVMIHVQDYVDKNGNMDNTKYIEFVKLLEGLKSLNARVTTFKDLVRYEPVRNVMAQPTKNITVESNESKKTRINVSHEYVYKWFDAPWAESVTALTFGRNDCERVSVLISETQDEKLLNDVKIRAWKILDTIMDEYNIKYEKGLNNSRPEKFMERYCKIN